MTTVASRFALVCLECLAVTVEPDRDISPRRYACPCGNNWITTPAIPSIKEIEMPPETYDVDRFTADTSKHELTVLRDDGLYRHLRFKAPGTGFYWFDLVTWPGYLSITGDVASYTFTRTTDMFEFFRGERINPQYWAEKVASGLDGVKVFSEDRFRSTVEEEARQLADSIDGRRIPMYVSAGAPAKDFTCTRAGFLAAVQSEILDDGNDTYHEAGAVEALNDFTFPDSSVWVANDADRIRFTDTYELDFADWGWSFLWCCHAIRWGIGQYDANRSATAETAVAA